MKKTILALSVVALLASCTHSTTEEKPTCDSTKVCTDSTKVTTDTIAKKDSVVVKIK